MKEIIPADLFPNNDSSDQSSSSSDLISENVRITLNQQNWLAHLHNEQDASMLASEKKQNSSPSNRSFTQLQEENGYSQEKNSGVNRPHSEIRNNTNASQQKNNQGEQLSQNATENTKADSDKEQGDVGVRSKDHLKPATSLDTSSKAGNDQQKNGAVKSKQKISLSQLLQMHIDAQEKSSEDILVEKPKNQKEKSVRGPSTLSAQVAAKPLNVQVLKSEEQIQSLKSKNLDQQRQSRKFSSDSHTQANGGVISEKEALFSASNLDYSNQVQNNHGVVNSKMMAQERLQIYRQLILKSFAQNQADGTSTSTVRMFPAHLGNLTMNLQIHGSHVNATFIVDNKHAQQLLLNDLQIIRDELGHQQISIENIRVQIRSNDLEEQLDDFSQQEFLAGNSSSFREENLSDDSSGDENRSTLKLPENKFSKETVIDQKNLILIEWNVDIIA